MRHLTGLIVVAAAGLVSTPALMAETPQDIIERAMKARSENAKMLDKQRVEIIGMEGKMYIDNTEIPTRKEIQTEWPTLYRMSYELATPEGLKRITMGLQIDKAWRQSSGMPAEELTLSDIDEFKADIHGQWLATLYPLKDKAFTLTLLPESKFDGEAVSVVKAAFRFRPDVSLSFSKKSGHLVRIDFKAREAGVEVRKQSFYSDYKIFNGLTLPAKQVDMFNGKRIAEWTVTGYKFAEPFGKDSFVKPDKK